jgi:peroxiredoxin
MRKQLCGQSMQPAMRIQRAVPAQWRCRIGILGGRLIFVPAILIIGLAMLAASNAVDKPKPPGSTALAAIEDPALSLFALPSLDGPVRELAQLRGRVVLVHFFATWCEPCRAEIASLRELQSRLEDRPFAIVPISVAETSGAVRRFFAGDAVPFAVLLDQDRSVARAWNIHALPSTVVLDLGLKPRFIAEGDVDWARPDVVNLLAQLLMERAK